MIAARQGYLAAAPNLYHSGSRLRCLRTIVRDMSARRGRTFDDIEAFRSRLAEHGGCNGKIGVRKLSASSGQPRRRLPRRPQFRRQGPLTDGSPQVYPEASHGFLNDHDPADQTLLLLVLARLSETRYHELRDLDGLGLTKEAWSPPRWPPTEAAGGPAPHAASP